jgi:hypothetical protein
MSATNAAADGETDRSPPTQKCSPLAAFGHAFGLLTMAINLADIATDYTVAVQFYQEGETTWFGLVTAGLIVAHICYALHGGLVLAQVQPYNDCIGELPVVLRVLMFALLGPLLPTVDFVIQTMRECRGVPENDYVSEYNNTRNANVATLNRSSGAQFVASSQSSAAIAMTVSADLDQTMQQHFQKFGLFYTETAVESAPQAVIQLLAISFLGRATEAQLLSLCCSLFSITSKAFVLSRSFDYRVFAFSFLVLVHDVFSAFYLFSTVVAEETTKETDFFGLEVSYLGCIWLWKMAIIAGIIFAGCVFEAVVGFILYRSTADECCPVERWRSSGLALLSILVLGPVLLVYEAMRLGHYAVWRPLLEYDGPTSAKEGLLWFFLDGDDATSSRMKHVLSCLVATSIYSQTASQTDALSRYAARPTPDEIMRDPVAYARKNIEPWGKPIPTKSSGGWCDNFTIVNDYHVSLFYPQYYYRRLWHELLNRPRAERISWPKLERTLRLSFTGLTVQEVESPLPWYHGLARDMSRNTIPSISTTRFLWKAFMICFGIVGQLFSFSYLFVHAATNGHYGRHNVLQSVCFHGAVAALVLALPFTPVAFRYMRHIFCFTNPRTDITYVSVSQWVAAYFEPSVQAAVLSVVPVDVLPGPLTVLVASFLPRDDGVDLSTLSVDERVRLRQRMVLDDAVDSALRIDVVPPEDAESQVVRLEVCADAADGSETAVETPHEPYPRPMV